MPRQTLLTVAIGLAAVACATIPVQEDAPRPDGEDPALRRSPATLTPYPLSAPTAATPPTPRREDGAQTPAANGTVPPPKTASGLPASPDPLRSPELSTGQGIDERSAPR